MSSQQINWGIIGCGDVAEVKSGPAFNKIEGSKLVGVMRRNKVKVKDFADRHQVPFWTDDLEEILNHPEINAVYIATPPSSHLEICLKALSHNKMVYLEKPMVLNLEEAHILQKAVEVSSTKICVAHYRRALPAFEKVKSLLDIHAIGKVRMVEVDIRQGSKAELIADSDVNWRTDPTVSGGGYFYDLAPHQIDLMLFYFGPVNEVLGISTNQSQQYNASDITHGLMKFESDVHFSGTWIFNVHESDRMDRCKIFGENGSITFSFYGDKVILSRECNIEEYKFNNPKHIQEPMISKVVDYFSGRTNCNPCSVEVGTEVISIMEKMSLK